MAMPEYLRSRLIRLWSRAIDPFRPSNLTTVSVLSIIAIAGTYYQFNPPKVLKNLTVRAFADQMRIKAAALRPMTDTAAIAAFDDLLSGLNALFDAERRGADVRPALRLVAAHAKHMRVAAHSLIPLPEELSFPAGAAVACGTGTAFGALKRIDLKEDETLAVFGQGPVGLSTTLLAAEMGARVIAIEVSPERRQLALDWGANVIIDPSADDPVAAIMALTDGQGADKAIDCTSSVDARRAAVQSTRVWGTACMVGIGGDLQVEVRSDLIHRQLNVVGHWTFSKTLQADCAQFIADRKIVLDNIFTHQWSINDAQKAYTLLDQAKTGKGVFVSFD